VRLRTTRAATALLTVAMSTLALIGLAASSTAVGAPVPPGFTDTVVLSGFTNPIVVRFASDGHVFVAEKSGIIEVFDNLADTTPTTVADLSTKVHNFWDRGFLGMALDPSYPTVQTLYVLYTHDAAIGGTAPRWGDTCPTPPGATGDGCVVSGRLSRLTLSDGVATGEQVLVEDWCQQYPSHSMGSLQFGADGALYVSAGDGASFDFADWGQDGSPLNPCGDPPTGAGTALSPPTAEGGALRAQDLRTPSDPTTLDGSILRLDPATGQAMPNNPLAGSADPNARRIIAHGLRNPFRFTIKPTTNELWIGDVGWNTWEEINRLTNPTGAVTNFGWPCYEGNARQGGYDAANLNICETLYGQAGAVTGPVYAYSHSEKVVANESCPTGSSSLSGMAFYNGGTYPTAYNGALFFADYSRRCIWVMFADAAGVPDPATRQTFIADAAAPVDLTIGPGGDLYYADFDGGTIHRVRFPTSNQAPNAVASASPTSGPVPLTVNFDASGSSDPNAGDVLTYAWDLDADGAFDDSTSVAPSWTYTQPGNVTVRLRVSDQAGASSIASVVISAGNSAPVPTIATPASGTTWKAGDVIAFSGSASDAEDGALAASRLTWSLVMQHCPSNCHSHPIQDFAGVAGGSFVAPDHEYPSHLDLRLTATDSAGLSGSTTLRLDPQTVELTFESVPSGLQLAVGSTALATPFTRTVIVNSANSVSAPPAQSLGGTNYAFASWSDGGPASHNIVAGASASTYTATYTPTGPSGLVGAWGFDETSGTGAVDSSGSGNAGTLAGPTRVSAGRYGGALSFDGSNDWVTVPDANSLDLTNRATISAWVRPTGLGTTWRTVAFKEQTAPAAMVYALYANQDASRPVAQVSIAGEVNAIGTATLPVDTWSYLASTYDGSALRLYVNGTLVSTTPVTGSMNASSGPFRIGGNAVFAEWFAGLIDEVRLYNRALSQSELQNDMNTPIGAAPPPDTTAPTAPTGLVANHGPSGIGLGWNASTDNVAVTRYNIHRSTTPGFTPTLANRVAQAATTSYTDPGLAAGTYYYRVTAEDAAANVSASSNEANATVPVPPPPDTTPPSAPAGLAATYGSSGVGLGWTASTDDVGVTNYNVHRSTTPGFTPSAANRVAQPVGTSYTDAGLPPGTYYYRVTAQDAASNVSGTSNEANATVPSPPPSTGLVASYSFNAGSGPSLADNSGNGNTGSISGAVWSANGKYGNALSFDGANDIVTINDAASLDLTNGMTLEAWVSPAALGGTWRTVLMKEQPGQLVYAVYASEGSSRASGHVYSGGDLDTRSPNTIPLNTWTHLAVTYDGATLRLYVNGAQVSTRAVAGSMPNSTGALRLGGNTVWAEWFSGLIDEVRLYNRALSAPEVQTDMNTPIGGSPPPDTTPPSAPTSLVATNGPSGIGLGWNASTDNVAVTNYNVHRSTTPGFTPSAANRIAQPTGTSYTDPALPAGTYYYRVTAQDAAGNLSAPSNEANATVAAPPPSSGLVAAYSFNAGSGTTLTDLSGTGNNGTISGATWSTQGRNGGALSFDGVNDLVTVADAPSLDLTTSMSLEAWVRPASVTNWRTVLLKEQPGQLVYGLYANNEGNRPSAHVFIGGDRELRGSARLTANAWTHLAMSYDGTNVRLYVNGTQAAALALSGSILTSNSPLRIGGNTVWSEWFSGLVDDIRIYNRVLTQAQIQIDMNTPVG
jgi:glucose/arabinose dehydrogenase/fibronectin type 3 domain-containing protein